ncbi:MAG: hypothetical protein M1330_01915 [Armatimonadetes bacterium]|nr:hypothetical protein [Armatimonadota bacterium]
MTRYLNSFIIIGTILLLMSIAGVVSGNTLITEPGYKVQQWTWLEYLLAALIMLFNGWLTWKVVARHAAEKAAKADKESNVSPSSAAATKEANRT